MFAGPPTPHRKSGIRGTRGFATRTMSKLNNPFTPLRLFNFVPTTNSGCPISRSFFARCGIPLRYTANSPGMDRALFLPYNGKPC
jgi:hypothetical protein